MDSSQERIAEARSDLPRRFGKFLLFDHIGRGGMADIYLALLKGDVLERRVVVKQILPHLSGDPGFGEMLISEAKLAANLSHANVVQTWELGREEEQLFIAMEYVEGFDLNQLLRRLSKAKIGLPAQFAILVVREVLRALDYAHRGKDGEGNALGLVHRDVSPSNVLISFEGEVKLCDFGIARAMSAAPDEVRVARARVAGKSAYMSPEHARGDDINARADVFAAGILLWELCAGRRMYKGSEEIMLGMAKRGEVPRLVDRGLPSHAELQQILDWALSADREQRYATAASFLADLEDYAVQHRLMASQLKFGAFLTEHFAEEIVDVRAARERAAKVEHSPVEQVSFVRSVSTNAEESDGSAAEEEGRLFPAPVKSAKLTPRAALFVERATEMLPAVAAKEPVSASVWLVAGLLVAVAIAVAGALIWL